MADIRLEDTIYQEEVYQTPPKITIIIATPWKELGEGQALLLRILSKIRLPAESVRIIYQRQFDLAEIIEKPSRMIAFITPPKGLMEYEVIQTGETSIVFSEPLEILENDGPAKLKLWAALQVLFPA